MAGRKQWTAKCASAVGSTTITSNPAVLGGLGIQTTEKTSTDVRILDGAGGTQVLRYGKLLGGRSAATIGNSTWVNLTHPIHLNGGIAVSLGAGTTQKVGRVTVLYKET